MISHDLDFAHKLTVKEDWGNTKEEIAEILKFNPSGCFVCEVSGESIGMVMTTRYDRIAFLGNLIISESFRGEGRGEDLTKHALTYLENAGVETVMLDSVERAVPLYERLGFRRACRSLRLRGSIESEPSESLKTATRNDLSSISEIDRKHIGADRVRFLESGLMSSNSIGRVMELQDRIAGYIFATKKTDFVWLGPWILSDELSRDEEMLRDAAALHAIDSQRVGVLETNSRALSCFQKCGLEITGFSWRMVRGSSQPVFSMAEYAIGSPARG
ncbi:MAG: GNAT family N-acetyltransferase [Candidatus Thorarchaeota archaeon]|nr:MAG: GNAT family N-acetyltransferase [Candidatus Thorarchaeota archaeon]